MLASGSSDPAELFCVHSRLGQVRCALLDEPICVLDLPPTARGPARPDALTAPRHQRDCAHVTADSLETPAAREDAQAAHARGALLMPSLEAVGEFFLGGRPGRTVCLLIPPH